MHQQELAYTGAKTVAAIIGVGLLLSGGFLYYVRGRYLRQH